MRFPISAIRPSTSCAPGAATTPRPLAFALLKDIRMNQLPLFPALSPVIERRAEVPAGAVFLYAGRPLRIIKAMGTDPAAPVIVEELASFGKSLKGQFAIWSADAVSRVMMQRTI